jgi:universal stress protein A
MIHPVVKHILCPVDLGSQTAAILKWAGFLAKSFNSHITILHADYFEIPKNVKESIAQPYGNLITSQTENFHAQLIRMGKKHLGNQIDWDAVVTDGRPGEKILDWTKNNRIDFIVMGSHKRGMLSRFFLGSISENLIRNISCPTLIVRNTTEDQPRLEQIFCATDNLTKGCLDIVSNIALSSGGDLYILHIVKEITELGEQDPTLQNWLSVNKQISPHIIKVLQKRNVSSQILDWAQTHNMDLVAVGITYFPSLKQTSLTPTISKLIHHSNCSVLLVPHKDSQPEIQITKRTTHSGWIATET